MKNMQHYNLFFTHYTFDFLDSWIFLFFSAEKLPVRVFEYSNTQHRVFKSNFVFSSLTLIIFNYFFFF